MIIQYSNPWFQVEKQGNYHFIAESNAANGAAVLPLVNNTHCLLLRMQRPAHPGQTLLEIPRGYGTLGETSAECARRELLEETGIPVWPGKLEHLGRYKPNSAILTTSVDLYLARLDSAKAVQQPDDEALNVELVSLPQLQQMVCRGEIEDGFTLAALAFYFNRQLLVEADSSQGAD